LVCGTNDIHRAKELRLYRWQATWFAARTTVVAQMDDYSNAGTLQFAALKNVHCAKEQQSYRQHITKTAA